MTIDGGSGWIFILDGELQFSSGICGPGAVSDASAYSSNRLLAAESAQAIGIRFHPGAHAYFSSVPIQGIGGTHNTLIDAGIDTTDLVKALRKTSDWPKQGKLIDHWLMDRMNQYASIDANIQALVRLIARKKQPITSGEFSQICHLSTRQVQRRFKAQVGISPRRLGVIVRANAALERIREASTHKLTLAEVALSNGYSDQAHMARDFRVLFGETPNSFIESGP